MMLGLYLPLDRTIKKITRALVTEELVDEELVDEESLLFFNAIAK